jgi:hypothetical protein
MYNFSIACHSDCHSVRRLVAGETVIHLFELVLSVGLDDVNASLLIKRYPSSPDDGSRQDPISNHTNKQRSTMALNIDDLRVLDRRKSILIVQFRLGLALVDLGTADKAFNIAVKT